MMQTEPEPRTLGSLQPDQRRRAILFAGAGLALGACASPAPAPKPVTVVPTTLVIDIQARPDINPDLRGRPSPVVLRLFELKTAAPFEGADFFALYERDQATLGAELLGSEQLVLSPGETQKVTRKAHADTRYVGVVAAFRDLEHSIWRAVTPVLPPAVDARAGRGESGREQRLTVLCERASVRIQTT